ncbi:hypothetical protein AGR13a_Lc30086 [Agrobacterium genomosp. 13 str. CFBP 6927]|uniref:Transposase n=1 Tax=Agrobacterium genomosp. 13 str. CFBP 6927 TaxID=1183428 RepID=A0ABM9VLD0_9HYPH|nr:hypothetical protein AGR13a_Lc30086 [Agrobacterium genomosp. 13 str. CFBP 6927]
MRDSHCFGRSRRRTGLHNRSERFNLTDVHLKAYQVR